MLLLPAEYPREAQETPPSGREKARESKKWRQDNRVCLRVTGGNEHPPSTMGPIDDSRHIRARKANTCYASTSRKSIRPSLHPSSSSSSSSSKVGGTKRQLMGLQRHCTLPIFPGLCSRAQERPQKLPYRRPLQHIKFDKTRCRLLDPNRTCRTAGHSGRIVLGREKRWGRTLLQPME